MSVTRGDEHGAGARPPKPPRRPRRWLLAVALVAVALLGVGRLSDAGPELRDVPLSKLLADAKAHKIAKVSLDDSRRVAVITYKGDGAASAVSAYPFFFGPDLADTLVDAGVVVDAEPLPRDNLLVDLALSLVPILVLLGFFTVILGRRAGLDVAKMAKGRAEAVDVPATRFSDVAGLDEVVDELREVAEFLHDPGRFTRTGARIPSGFLLEGGPGTGKTLLARAVAGEAGVPFFSLAGSDFVETFVGVGARRVRDVFAKARKTGRAIVFIDEIDAVGKARAAGPATGANDERESTLNALLVEMDGFASSGVIVLGATNRADMLDPALLRPGRFDRRIVVPNPDRGGREQILRLHARTKPVAADVDWAGLARRTAGMSGADLEHLLNEASLAAARAGATAIEAAHLEAALQTVMLGRERRSASVTDRDRRIAAYHEAGHAVAALVCEAAGDPVQVTIVPRGGAGGVTWFDPGEHDFLTRAEARDRLTVALAGRAAEELLLDGDFTSGAAGDLRQATKLATAMVCDYGMSDLGLAWRSAELVAHGTQADRVAEAVDAILADALGRARALVTANRAVLDAVAAALLEAETISGEDLAAIAASVTAA